MSPNIEVTGSVDNQTLAWMENPHEVLERVDQGISAIRQLINSERAVAEKAKFIVAQIESIEQTMHRCRQLADTQYLSWGIIFMHIAKWFALLFPGRVRNERLERIINSTIQNNAFRRSLRRSRKELKKLQDKWQQFAYQEIRIQVRADEVIKRTAEVESKLSEVKKDLAWFEETSINRTIDYRLGEGKAKYCEFCDMYTNYFPTSLEFITATRAKEAAKELKSCLQTLRVQLEKELRSAAMLYVQEAAEKLGYQGSLSEFFIELGLQQQ